MKEGICQPVQRILTATETAWRVEWGRKFLAFCSDYNVPTLFKIYKWGLKHVGSIAVLFYYINNILKYFIINLYGLIALSDSKQYNIYIYIHFMYIYIYF
jgi:hypothetical protein